MPESPLIPINVVIADRSYRIKIDAEDEEMVRRTMKMVNEKIVEFKTHFSGKDMQDYVSMVLLWFATEQQKPLSAAAYSHDDEAEIKRMEDMLDKALAGA